MSSVWNQGGSSFTKNAKRTVRAGFRAANARARASVAATPLALSLAPGVPTAVS